MAKKAPWKNQVVSSSQLPDIEVIPPSIAASAGPAAPQAATVASPASPSGESDANQSKCVNVPGWVGTLFIAAVLIAGYFFGTKWLRGEIGGATDKIVSVADKMVKAIEGQGGKSLVVAKDGAESVTSQSATEPDQSRRMEDIFTPRKIEIDSATIASQARIFILKVDDVVEDARTNEPCRAMAGAFLIQKEVGERVITYQYESETDFPQECGSGSLIYINATKAADGLVRESSFSASKSAK